MLSLILGIALARYLDYLDDPRSTQDVENFLRLPALAVIPTMGARPDTGFCRQSQATTRTGITMPSS